MENKSYLDEQGVIKLLQDVSSSIANHTSGKIERDEVEDLDTGEITIGEAKHPNNFTTVKAVVDYLKNRKKIIVNQYQSIEQASQKVQYSYNGEEAAEINLNLVQNSDINNLF